LLRKCIGLESSSFELLFSQLENDRTGAVHPCYGAAAMARKLKTAVAAILAGTSVFAVMRWLRARPQEPRAGGTDHVDELVEEADLESFPASDPPSWTMGKDSEL
jgi:hypothetical protein